MNEEDEYLYGVVFEGRDLGWIAYDTRDDAEWQVAYVEDKYYPAYLARRKLGPVERLDF